MPEENNKTIRLSKAAKEFNVGMSTIIEFLGKKGFNIDTSPNTKISNEMYNLLTNEYQQEREVKNEAQKLGSITYKGGSVTVETTQNDIEDTQDEDSKEIVIRSNSIAKSETPKPQTEVSVTPKAEPVVEKTAEKTESPKETNPVQTPVNKPQAQEKVEPAVKQQTETKVSKNNAPQTENKPVIEEKKQEPVVAKPVIEPIAEPAQKENGTTSPQVKVLGKIDLDNMNLKTKPDPKSKEQKKKEAHERQLAIEKEKAEKQKNAPQKQAPVNQPKHVSPVQNASKEHNQPKPVQNQPVKPASETSTTPSPTPTSTTADGEEKNFIKTEFKKIEGPKILDKIVLPEERRKSKPVASSSDSKGDLKKKRKRIKSDAPQNQQGQGQGQGARPGQSGTQQRPNQGQGQNRNNSGRPNFNNSKPGSNTAKPGTSNNTGSGNSTVGGNNINRPGQYQNTKNKNDKFKKGKDSFVKDEKVELTEEEIQKQIKETLARLSPLGKSKTSKHRREKRHTLASNRAEEMMQEEQDKKVLKLTEFVTANELATMMAIPVTKVIATCMSLGMFVSINQRLDAEILSVVADEFGFKVEFVSIDVQEALAENDEPDNEEDLVERAPVVTVMGHVDHGKTKLLDYIRHSNVVAGEAGGITQHIGAYEVLTESGKKITFLDTPGHEAFTAMRARGASITDVAIIVIAADDSVMPQTVEAINHAQAANVPIVFAINKIDKPTANPRKIYEQLANMNILVEEWGGKYQSQEISAKAGLNVDKLLDKVLLEAEILDLKGNPKKMAKGTVIESALDKGRGYITKILVQDGTLRIGDIIIAGSNYGKVKAMFNERNQSINEAGPSTPVLLLGLNGAPQAGDNFNMMTDEKEVKAIANRRLQLQREQGLRTQMHITLDEIGRRIAIGDFKELNIIVKGDVDGSVEALSDSLLKLSTPEVQVNVIHKSVGAINESDIMLASASNAVIVGFQVRPTLQARKLAENEQIDIRLYSIIYQAIEEIKAAIEGMLAPEIQEVITCNISIKETFKINKVGTIAGCMVTDGKVTRNTKIRVIRDGIVIYTGSLGSLKRFKDDVKEVSAGYECGLNIENFNDIKVGDVIEGYEVKEISRKL